MNVELLGELEVGEAFLVFTSLLRMA